MCGGEARGTATFELNVHPSDIDTPAGHRPDPERPRPETAPYDVSWEDCPACFEAQDQCRYHAGVNAGMEYRGGRRLTVPDAPAPRPAR